MNICRNCKWNLPSDRNSTYDLCDHPGLRKLNPVTGEIDKPFCSIERRHPWPKMTGYCGSNGHLFEPKDLQS
jgi:hypothetical protein